MSPKVNSAFQASKITSSTFLVKEYNDIYSEHPHIYVKVVPSVNTILIIDTGCGGASNDNKIEIKSLRKFLESVHIDDNDGMPLNEAGGMGYIVVLTHCHYDHILGIEDFEGSLILASSHSPSFLQKDAIPEHSLCKALGIRTPNFTPSLVPNMHPITSGPNGSERLGVTILHTPGHTPDEIAVYDEEEMMLYVGDTLYEWEPIIFPSEGSIMTWMSSMDYLISYVEEMNSTAVHSATNTMSSEVLINSGHCTVAQPALEILLATKAFMEDVIKGREQVKEATERRGEKTVTYEQTGKRFSLRCPERLVHEARNMRRV